MPIIDITEQEQAVARVLSVTENTVLIPMLYCRDYVTDEEGYTYTETPSAKLYTSSVTLQSELSSKACYVRENENSVAKKDKSYIMAYDLVMSGLNVVIKPIIFDNAAEKYNPVGAPGTTVDFDEVITILADAFSKGALEEFKDRNIFNIKFVTAGAYPTIGYLHSDKETLIPLHTYLVDVAKTRCDAVAMLDLRDGFKDKEELLDEAKNINVSADYTYSVTTFPWVKNNITADGVESLQTMTGTYGQLKSFANSIKSNANWFSPAGVQRGYIPGMVSPTFVVGEALMHILQGDKGYRLKTTNKYTKTVNEESKLGIRINPIMNAGTYGYRIWGNMTSVVLSDEGTQRFYKEFFNVRLLVCDLVKTLYHSSMYTMFEPDDDITWLSFKSRVNTSFLEKAKTGRGVEWYKWNKLQPEDRAELNVSIELKPIVAVDTIKVNMIMTDENTTTVTEE